MKLKIFLLTLLLLLNCGNIFSQTIYDQVAATNSAKTPYIKSEIASSNAFAYTHKNYIPKVYEKILYMIHPIDDNFDEKIAILIEDEFKKVGMEAVNMENLSLPSNLNSNQIKDYLVKLGFNCILKISVNSQLDEGDILVTNYYQTHYGIHSFSRYQTWRHINTVFEWYNEEFPEEAFLKTKAVKLSRASSFLSLLNGNITLSIRRPIKYGLLIKPK